MNDSFFYKFDSHVFKNDDDLHRLKELAVLLGEHLPPEYYLQKSRLKNIDYINNRLKIFSNTYINVDRIKLSPRNSLKEYVLNTLKCLEEEELSKLERQFKNIPEFESFTNIYDLVRIYQRIDNLVKVSNDAQRVLTLKPILYELITNDSFYKTVTVFLDENNFKDIFDTDFDTDYEKPSFLEIFYDYSILSKNTDNFFKFIYRLTQNETKEVKEIVNKATEHLIERLISRGYCESTFAVIDYYEKAVDLVNEFIKRDFKKDLLPTQLKDVMQKQLENPNCDYFLIVKAIIKLNCEKTKSMVLLNVADKLVKNKKSETIDQIIDLLLSKSEANTFLEYIAISKSKNVDNYDNAIEIVERKGENSNELHHISTRLIKLKFYDKAVFIVKKLVDHDVKNIYLLKDLVQSMKTDVLQLNRDLYYSFAKVVKDLDYVLAKSVKELDSDILVEDRTWLLIVSIIAELRYIKNKNDNYPYVAIEEAMNAGDYHKGFVIATEISQIENDFNPIQYCVRKVTTFQTCEKAIDVINDLISSDKKNFQYLIKLFVKEMQVVLDKAKMPQSFSKIIRAATKLSNYNENDLMLKRVAKKLVKDGNHEITCKVVDISFDENDSNRNMFLYDVISELILIGDYENALKVNEKVIEEDDHNYYIEKLVKKIIDDELNVSSGIDDYLKVVKYVNKITDVEGIDHYCKKINIKLSQFNKKHENDRGYIPYKLIRVEKEDAKNHECVIIIQ